MAKDVPYIEALRRLRTDAESFPPSRRRELAVSLGKAFESGKGDETTVALACLLANDANWEVRKAVANLLSSLPDAIEVRLIAQLSTDSNAFVRRAVDQAIDRRRKTSKNRVRQQRGLEQVRADFEAMEQKFGPAAARRARRIVDRMYEILARTAAHELLGRMTPLKSDAAQLIANVRGKKIDADALERTLQGVAERLDFIERFLFSMKSYATAVKPERTRERISDVVAEAHRESLEKLKGWGLEVPQAAFQTNAPDNITIEMSRMDLVVALSDLIKNAYESFKDASSGTIPTVSVDVRRLPEDRVQIRIQDNGCGLTDAELEDVKAYVPGKSSKKVMGTGFGVPNARRVVLEHGGSFDFTSVVDKGTTVTAVLPLKQKRDALDEL